MVNQYQLLYISKGGKTVEIMKEKGSSTFFYKDKEALKKNEWYECRVNGRNIPWWSGLVESVVTSAVYVLFLAMEIKEKIPLKRKNKKSPEP